MSAEEPPGPFEDVAAPPLRLRPRAERPRVSAPPPETTRVAPPETAAGTPAEPEPQTTAGPSSAEPAALRATPFERSPDVARREVALALVVGLAIAAAIVAGAVYLQPEPAPTAVGSGPVPAPVQADTPVSATTVRLRLPANVPAARIEALRAALSGAGFRRVDVDARSEAIEETRVEYFNPEDRVAAESLAAALAPLAGGPLSAQAVKSETTTPAGRIDLWVAG